MDGHIEAVQRMQDYIAMHIDSNITMADLANVSRYSTWHSYRLFMDLLHMTPAVYIRRLRLSKSTLSYPVSNATSIIFTFSSRNRSADLDNLRRLI